MKAIYWNSYCLLKNKINFFEILLKGDLFTKKYKCKMLKDRKYLKTKIIFINSFFEA